MAAVGSTAPAASDAAAPPAVPEEDKKVTGGAKCVSYIIIFFASWFGSDRFDYDGDGDFDPTDVMCFLAECGIANKKYLMTEEQKDAARKRGAEKKKAEKIAAAKAAAEAKKRAESGEGAGHVLDRDGDGDFDIDDLVQNDVEGGAQEEEALANLKSGKVFPFFFLFEITATSSLWFIGAIMYSSNAEGSNFLTSKGGLDSFFPDQTNLIISNSDCDDFRGQIWRWLTYQFTHVGITHIGMNTLLNVILGLPLEAMHGWWRTAIMFNVGVFGGTCCYFVASGHTSVVGCSGGCYSLIGIHFADLVMNWSQKKFRLPTIVLLLSLVTADMVTYNLSGHKDTSNAAHFGGVVAGFCIGILFCDNKTVKDHEKVVMAVVFCIGFVLTLFCILWMALQTGGPRNIFEPAGWCWIRATLDDRVNPLSYECLRCGTKECIASFSSYEIRTVDDNWCKGKYFNVR